MTLKVNGSLFINDEVSVSSITRVLSLLSSNNAIAISVVGALASMSTMAVTSVVSWKENYRYQDSKLRGIDVQFGTFAGSVSEDANWALSKKIDVEDPVVSSRSYRIPVRYHNSFSEPPDGVITTVRTLVISGKTKDVSVLIGVEKRTISGCEIVVRVWGDTKLFSIEGNWIVFQSSPHGLIRGQSPHNNKPT